MQTEIKTRLTALGVEQVSVDLSLSPPWTTDWIAPQAHQKLKDFGIGPPAGRGGEIEILFSGMIPCPYCDSTNTEVRSAFGPTPCRALAFCLDCREPFEQIKPL
jgi:ring-1,2-phenylacetyl-CoA epoxidase subunit PaaD